MPQIEPSNTLAPASAAASAFASAIPFVLWRWTPSRIIGQDSRISEHSRCTLSGPSSPILVATVNSSTPSARIRSIMRRTAILGNLALVGAEHRDRDPDHEREAGLARHLGDGGHRVEVLVDAHPRVLAVVGLAGGDQPDQLVDAGRDGALGASPVRHERAVDAALDPLEAGEHLLRVGELRDHVGPHEGRDLDLAQAGAAEQADQLELRLERKLVREALETVARADLDDRDPLGEAHGVRVSGCAPLRAAIVRTRT